MGYAPFWIIKNIPPLFLSSKTKVSFFYVYEIIFIQISNLINHFFPYHEKRTSHPIKLLRFIIKTFILRKTFFLCRVKWFNKIIDKWEILNCHPTKNSK